MNATEIRNRHITSESSAPIEQTFFLQEIAAQLAEHNEVQRQMLELHKMARQEQKAIADAMMKNVGKR